MPSAAPAQGEKSPVRTPGRRVHNRRPGRRAACPHGHNIPTTTESDAPMKIRMLSLAASLAALLTAVAAAPARADITVGVSVSATGPAASLGIPEKNTIALLPRTIAGQKVNYIVLDDATDTTAAVANARKLVADKVDILL